MGRKKTHLQYYSKLIMKDKLLFYIDNYFVHFGIAKAIQEKYDCDLFAIIDVDAKAKKFFKNQDIVQFSKVWHYLEHVSTTNKKPDLEYLQSFEEKYKINLWSIAYTDKYFYKYNTHYQFSNNEILSIIEQECRLFEQVLDETKPDFIVMLVPILHYQQLLYEICKSRGIKVLMLITPKIAGRLLISEDPVIVDEKNTRKKSSMSHDELQSYMKRFDMFKLLTKKQKIGFEANKWQRYKSILKYFFNASENDYKNRYSNYGITRFKTLTEKISRSLKRKYRESFFNRNFKRSIDDKKPFIYFPLHYEPERILLIDAPYYDNQIAVITSIAKSLPVGYSLILKEHPFMKTIGWRNISFYKELMNLPNVEILHPLVNPVEIMKKCSLVVTIAGTTGLEAALYKKPTIILSDQLYSNAPFAFRLNKIEDLPKTIRLALQKEVNLSDVGEFVRDMDDHTFELNFFQIINDFAYRFGFKGPLIDAELPATKIRSFLEDYKNDFELLADEHIKKIHYHKKKAKL